MSDPVQRIGESEFDNSNSGRPRSGSRWEMRIPSIWSSAAGFITGPTNFWMTDDSMIRELIKECNSRGVDPTGRAVHWITLEVTSPSEDTPR